MESRTTLMSLIVGGRQIAIFRKFHHHFPLITTPPDYDFEIFEEQRTAIFRKCHLILSFSCIFLLFLCCFPEIFLTLPVNYNPPFYQFSLFFQPPLTIDPPTTIRDIRVPTSRTKAVCEVPPPQDTRTWLKLRGGVFDLKANRPYQYLDTLCRACGLETEDFDHIANNCAEIPCNEDKIYIGDLDEMMLKEVVARFSSFKKKIEAGKD